MKVKLEFDQLIDKKNELRQQLNLIDKIIKETHDLKDKSRGRGIFWKDLDTYYGCEKRIEGLHELRKSIYEYFEIIDDRIDKLEPNK